jgi:hypothetical protein
MHRWIHRLKRRSNPTICFAACAFALTVATVAACAHDAHSRVRVAEAWQDAPAPDRSPNALSIRYVASRFIAYSIHQEVKLASKINGRIVNDIVFHFRPGTSENSRDMLLYSFDNRTDIGGLHMNLHIDEHGMTESRGRVQRHMSATDRSRIDLPALLGSPILTLTIDPESNGIATSSTGAVWDTLTNGGALDLVILLFPEFPRGGMMPGRTWKVTRTVNLPNGLGSYPIEYELQYAGESPCPSTRNARCLQITIHGDSTGAKFKQGQHEGSLSIAYSGTIFASIDGGNVDEARLRLAADLEMSGAVSSIDSTIALKSITASVAPD